MQTHTQNLHLGDAVYSLGKPGLFNNMIHQVQANEPSLVLHIFSDDALKGEVYTLLKNHGRVPWLKGG